MKSLKTILANYYWVFILAAIGLFILVGAIYRVAIIEQFKQNLDTNYSYEELEGRPYKVPLFDDNEVTLKGDVIVFVNNGAEFKLVQFDKVIKGEDVAILPMRLIRNDGKEVYLLTAYIKQGNSFNQAQSALLGPVVKNQEFSLEASVLRAKYDTIDKYDNPTFEEKFFNTKKGRFSPYYPYIDNGAIGLEIIQGVWEWKKTQYGTGETILPRDDKFSLQLDENGNFEGRTDCNDLTGKFIMTGSGSATFGQIASTKKYCEDSQELVFTDMLLDIQGFNSTGSTLNFFLKTNSGSMIFEKQQKQTIVEEQK